MKLGITSNFDLEKIANELNLKISVISKKHLTGIIKPNQMCIVNIDDIHNRGTHWVCCFKRNNQSIFFDSFGLPAPTDIRKFLGKPKIIYNSSILQDASFDSCGYWCLFYLFFMKNSKISIKNELLHNQFCAKFGNNTKLNEKKLEDIFNNFVNL